MKDVYICITCGFVSTIRSEFVKVGLKKHQCKECNAEAPANIQQQLQPENGQIKCTDNGCAGWENGLCARPGKCRGVAVSG